MGSRGDADSSCSPSLTPAEQMVVTMSLRISSGTVDWNIILLVLDAYMHGSRFSQSKLSVPTPLH